MSRHSTRRVAAVLSALALALTGVALTTTADATVSATGCCTGHKYTWYDSRPVLQHRPEESLGREREGDGPYAQPLPAACHRCVTVIADLSLRRWHMPKVVIDLLTV